MMQFSKQERDGRKRYRGEGRWGKAKEVRRSGGELRSAHGQFVTFDLCCLAGALLHEADGAMWAGQKVCRQVEGVLALDGGQQTRLRPNTVQLRPGQAGSPPHKGPNHCGAAVPAAQGRGSSG